ncbi:MAG: hypothetical protein N4A35_02935 [Flavobacteriales bacterium]|jgi:hypothetical protein|nr:hypothetical protein [Flavobacteriales bacterium]
MIEGLPYTINALFLCTAIITIVFFHLANKNAKKAVLLLIIGSLLQLLIAFTGFYHDTDDFPPHFTFVLVPSTLAIVYGLLPKQKEAIIQGRNLKISTLSHVVRVPVEICLFYLFQYQMIPELMTFEGRNFDIIAGLTAPLMSWLYAKQKIANKILLIWNWIGLGLVLFILINGILSAELPFQQFAFDQPNKALEYPPYVLLPALIVPVVVYTHITDIIKLHRAVKK